MTPTSAHQTPPIEAIERRLSAAKDELALAVWRRDELARSGPTDPKELSASDERVAELEVSVEALQGSLAELRSSEVRIQLDELERNAADLQRSTNEAYLAVKKAITDADKFEMEYEKRRRELRDEANAAKSEYVFRQSTGATVSVDELRHAEGAYRTAVGAIEAHEKQSVEKRRECHNKHVAAERRWDSLRSQRLGAVNRLDAFRQQNGKIIAIIRATSSTA